MMTNQDNESSSDKVALSDTISESSTPTEFLHSWRELQESWGAKIVLYQVSASFMRLQGLPASVIAGLRHWVATGETPADPPEALSRPLCDTTGRFLRAMRAALDCTPAEFVDQRIALGSDWVRPPRYAGPRAAGTPVVTRPVPAPPVLGPNNVDDDDETLESTFDGEDAIDLSCSSHRIKTLAQLLTAAEVDLNEWRVESYTANKWDTLSKAGVVEMFQVKARLVRIPEELRGPSHVERIPRATSSSTLGKIALIIPDSQHGYVRDLATGEMTPMHDPTACALAVACAAYYQPTDIVILGDMLDLAPFGHCVPRRQPRVPHHPRHPGQVPRA
jgi:hypothetical protein